MAGQTPSVAGAVDAGAPAEAVAAARRWVGRAFPGPIGRQPVVSFVVVHDEELPAGGASAVGVEVDAWVEVVPDRGGAGRSCRQPLLAGLPRAQHHPARGAGRPRSAVDAGVAVLGDRRGAGAGRVPTGRPRREPAGPGGAAGGLHLGVRRGSALAGAGRAGGRLPRALRERRGSREPGLRAPPRRADHPRGRPRTGPRRARARPALGAGTAAAVRRAGRGGHRQPGPGLPARTHATRSTDGVPPAPRRCCPTTRTARCWRRSSRGRRRGPSRACATGWTQVDGWRPRCPAPRWPTCADTFALTAPASAPRLLRRAVAAYPDGLAVAAAVRAGGTDEQLATALGTTTQRVSADRPALEEHAAWCATTFGTGPASLDPRASRASLRARLRGRGRGFCSRAHPRGRRRRRPRPHREGCGPAAGGRRRARCRGCAGSRPGCSSRGCRTTATGSSRTPASPSTGSTRRPTTSRGWPSSSSARPTATTGSPSRCRSTTGPSRPCRRSSCATPSASTS